MADDASIWAKVKARVLGERGTTLRDQIEDAIDDADDGAANTRKDDLSATERQMLRNMLAFGTRTVGDVAVPRTDIIAVPDTLEFKELVDAFVKAEHSRLPVYRDNLDSVIGMVHIKDVFAVLAGDKKQPASINSLIREPRYAPPSMRVIDLLAEMRSTRTHLAIVIDEYSGTEGLVTIEDLVEEIVGDIEDEHDDAPVALITSLGDGNWEADARAELEDVVTMIDSRLGEVDGDVDTLGGLAFVLAGHVPQKGEIVVHESGWRLEIIAGDNRRASRIRLHAPVTSDNGQAS